MPSPNCAKTCACTNYARPARSAWRWNWAIASYGTSTRTGNSEPLWRAYRSASVLCRHVSQTPSRQKSHLAHSGLPHWRQRQILLWQCPQVHVWVCSPHSPIGSINAFPLVVGRVARPPMRFVLPPVWGMRV